MNETNYWNQFYSKPLEPELIQVPSQFAVFCVLEMIASKIGTVVEFGCGSGRDTGFFLRSGFRVISTDGSEKAVDLTRRIHSASNKFDCFVQRATDDFPAAIQSITEPKTLYARFLLHVLKDFEVRQFLKKCSDVMTPEDFLFVEYRTDQDAGRTKMTPEHYRNFLSEQDLTEWAGEVELKCKYMVQGIGMAKWKNDDAFVVRQIFQRVEAGV